MIGKDERLSQMTLQQIESWIDKTKTAASGTAALFQASVHEVARHAIKKAFLYLLTTRMRANKPLFFFDGNKIQG